MSQPPKCHDTCIENRKIDIAHILREHIVDYRLDDNERANGRGPQ